MIIPTECSRGLQGVPVPYFARSPNTGHSRNGHGNAMPGRLPEPPYAKRRTNAVRRPGSVMRWDGTLAHADFVATLPALPANDLSPTGGAHSRPEALLPGALNLAVTSRVVHSTLFPDDRRVTPLRSACVTYKPTEPRTLHVWSNRFKSVSAGARIWVHPGSGGDSQEGGMG